MDPQVLEALGGTSSSSSSSGAKTCSDSNQAQSDSKPRDDENQENSSSESGWSSWFQNVAKQVQTQTVQAAHRVRNSMRWWLSLCPMTFRGCCCVEFADF